MVTRYALQHRIEEYKINVLCEIPDFTVLISVFIPRRNKSWIPLHPTQTLPWFIYLLADHSLVQQLCPPVLPRESWEKICYDTHIIMCASLRVYPTSVQFYQKTTCSLKKRKQFLLTWVEMYLWDSNRHYQDVIITLLSVL